MHTRTPAVLQADLYVVAALAGASIVALGHHFRWPASPTLAVGALVCFGLRFMALRHGWHLLVTRPRDG